MSKHVFMSRKSMDSDIADGGLGYVTPPKMTFEATADFDAKVYALVAKDSIMLKEMNEAIKSFYADDVCDAIKKKMRVFDKLIEGMFDKNADLGTINKQLKGLNDALERDKDTYEKATQIVIDKVWQKYQKKQEAYKKYKVDISISVGLSAVTIGASFIGGLSSAPFTGGSSAVLAIIGIAKAGVRIARELASAYQAIETSIKLLEVQMDLLEKLANQWLGRKINEYTAALANEFFGIAQPSIKSCKTHLDVVRNKLTPVEVNLHDLGIKLNDILDAQEKLAKEFMKEANARLDKHPGADAKAQKRKIEDALDDAIAPSRKDVVEQIDLVGKAFDRFKKLDKEVEELAKRVKVLDEQRGVDEKFLRLVLSFAHADFDFQDALKSGLSTSKAAAAAFTPLSVMLADEIRGRALKDTYLEEK